MIATATTDRRTPYPVAARELLRETLLDAARAELSRRGWEQITMAEIAAAAGVSRQTLYNEFGSREVFVQALVLRESDRFLTAVERAVNAHLDDPVAALAGAFDVFLTASAEDPLLSAAVFGGADNSLLALVTTQGQPLVEHAAERLCGIILCGWPQAQPADARLLAESLVRLAISYAALPAGPSSMTAASVATLLGPFIERALAGGRGVRVS